MKLFIKMAAAVLAAALALTGCAGGNTSWAYQSGDEQIPVGLYIIYQANAFTDAGNKIAEENESDTEYDTPEPKELLSMTVEGQPAADWIAAKARESVREHIAVQNKFASLGLTLSDAELAYIDNGVASLKAQSGKFYEDNGISDSSIKDFYMNAVKKSRLFLSLYGEGGEFEEPKEAIEAYFEQNYIIADVLPMMLPIIVPEGETKTLDELKADVKAAAEEYLGLLRSGTEFEQIAYDWELRNAEGAARDEVKKPEKGDMTVILSEQNRASFGENFAGAVEASNVGEPAIVEDEGFIIIFERLDILADTALFENYISLLLQEMRYGEFEEKLVEWSADVQMEANNAALDRYRPNKIKFEK